MRLAIGSMLTLFLLGCPARKPGTDVLIDAASDAGDEDDAAVEDARTEDAGVTPSPPTITHSAGGGTIASPSYRMRLIVAPPTPAGEAESPGYRLQLGPGPAQHAR